MNVSLIKAVALIIVFSMCTAVGGEELFSLHVGIGNDVVKRLPVMNGDDPGLVAANFCDQMDQSSAVNCKQVVSAAIHRRLKWHSPEKKYVMIEQDTSIDYKNETNRFDAASPIGLHKGLEYLREHGYVVFKAVASVQDVERMTRLFWEYLEQFGVQKEYPTTWGKIPSNEYGIILSYGIGQSKFMWYLRSIPEVKKIFEAFWKTSDLIVDFGGCVVFRNVECASSFRTAEKWFHSKFHHFQCVMFLSVHFEWLTFF